MNPPPVEQLCAVLENAGFSREDVQAYLAFINAPQSLHCLIRISRNFIRLVPAIRKILALNFMDFGMDLFFLSSVEKVALAIAAKPEGIESIPSIDRQATGSLQAPLWRYYEKNSFYVTLWYPADENSCEDQFLQLMAYLTLSLYSFRELDLEDRTYDVMLKARQISDPKHEELIGSYPAQTVRLDEYVKDLASKPDDKFRRAFLILFRYVLEQREPQRRSPSVDKDDSESEDKRKHEPCEPIRTDLSIDTEHISVQIHRMLDLSMADKEEVEASGCIAAEQYSDKEFITTTFHGDNPIEGRSSAQHLIRVRNAASYVAMQNQHLIGRWDTLSEYEVKSLLNEILELGESDDPIKLEMAFLLTKMFWTGCRLKDLWRFNHRAVIGSGNFGRSATRPGWNIKSVHPFVDRSVSTDVSSQTPEVAKGFFLPCPAQFIQIIEKIGRMSKTPDLETYENNQEVFEERLKQIVKNINVTHGCRLTLNRISDYLFYRLISQYDITIAMLITGRNTWIGENPLHYTGVTANHLQICYGKTCSNILIESGIVKAGKHGYYYQPSGKIDKSQCIIGSRFLPHKDTIKKLKDHLRAQIEKYGNQPFDLSNLIGYHNALTLYTVFMIGFFTGFRAVRDPYFNESEIDWDTGFAVISDKDSADRYNSRLVWLPPVCLSQIRFYSSHLDYLYKHLMLVNPTLYRRVMNRRSGSDQSGVPLLLLFDLNRNGLEYRPAVISEMVYEAYKLPLNANRHILRSRMLEMNVESEVINAFMGHWERGQEPWGLFSGMSPLSYRSSLKQFFSMDTYSSLCWKEIKEHPWA